MSTGSGGSDFAILLETFTTSISAASAGWLVWHGLGAALGGRLRLVRNMLGARRCAWLGFMVAIAAPAAASAGERGDRGLSEPGARISTDGHLVSPPWSAGAQPPGMRNDAPLNHPRPPAMPPWSEPLESPLPRPKRSDREAAGNTQNAQSFPRAGDVHVVRSGETLWGIAAMTLNTDDPVRIARYWPKIHRSNRSIVGANPNLIFAGQALTLPTESPRL